MNIIANIVDQNGVYIEARFSKRTENQLRTIQEKYKIENPNLDFHCTIIYSKDSDNFPNDEDLDFTLNQKVRVKSEIWDNTLVLVFYNEELNELNQDLTEKYNYKSDYDKYVSHITLSYDTNFQGIINEDIDLEITQIIAEPLNLSINASYVKQPKRIFKKKSSDLIPETKQDKIIKKRKEIK